jgi:hypothetical protein
VRSGAPGKRTYGGTSPNFNWIVHRVWKSLHNEEDDELTTREIVADDIENKIDPETTL